MTTHQGFVILICSVISGTISYMSVSAGLLDSYAGIVLIGIIFGGIAIAINARSTRQ